MWRREVNSIFPCSLEFVLHKFSRDVTEILKKLDDIHVIRAGGDLMGVSIRLDVCDPMPISPKVLFLL